MKVHQKKFSAGPELIDLGLDLPFPEKLKSALKERGVDVPSEYDRRKDGGLVMDIRLNK